MNSVIQFKFTREVTQIIIKLVYFNTETFPQAFFCTKISLKCSNKTTNAVIR